MKEPKFICVRYGCENNYGGKCDNNPDVCPDAIWEDNPDYDPEEDEEE